MASEHLHLNFASCASNIDDDLPLGNSSWISSIRDLSISSQSSFFKKIHDSQLNLLSLSIDPVLSLDKEDLRHPSENEKQISEAQEAIVSEIVAHHRFQHLLHAITKIKSQHLTRDGELLNSMKLVISGGSGSPMAKFFYSYANELKRKQQEEQGLLIDLQQFSHQFEVDICDDLPGSSGNNQATAVMKRSFNAMEDRLSSTNNSTTVLLDWFENNFTCPFPSDDQKTKLAEESGLTLKQLSDWFVNRRKRRWRPIVNDLKKAMEQSR